MPRIKKNSVSKLSKKQSKPSAKKIESKEQQPAAEDAYIIYEKTDRDKRIAIWSGVIFVMIIVVIVWIQVTKHSIQRAVEESRLNQQTESWENFTNLLNERLDELTQDLDSIKEFGEDNGENSIPEGEARELFSSGQTNSTTTSSTVEKAEEEQATNSE